MTNKLFVAGLEYSVTDSQLNEHFSTIGQVLSAKVILDRDTGRGRGFGFVEMENEKNAKLAMNKLNNSQINGRPIFVKESRPREKK